MCIGDKPTIPYVHTLERVGDFFRRNGGGRYNYGTPIELIHVEGETNERLSVFIGSDYLAKVGDRFRISFDCEGVEEGTVWQWDLIIGDINKCSIKHISLDNKHFSEVISITEEMWLDSPHNHSACAITTNPIIIWSQETPIIIKNLKVEKEQSLVNAYIGDAESIDYYSNNLLKGTQDITYTFGFNTSTNPYTIEVFQGRVAIVNRDCTLGSGVYITETTLNNFISEDIKQGEPITISCSLWMDVANKFKIGLEKQNLSYDIDINKLNQWVTYHIFTTWELSPIVFYTFKGYGIYAISHIKIERGHNPNPKWSACDKDIKNLIDDTCVGRSCIVGSNGRALQFPFSGSVITGETLNFDFKYGILNSPYKNIIIQIYDYTTSQNIVDPTISTIEQRNVILKVVRNSVKGHDIKLNVYPGSEDEFDENNKPTLYMEGVMLTKDSNKHVWKPSENDMNMITGGGIKQIKGNISGLSSYCAWYQDCEQLKKDEWYTISACVHTSEKVAGFNFCDKVDELVKITSMAQRNETVYTKQFQSIKNTTNPLRILFASVADNIEPDKDTYVKWIVLQKGKTSGVTEWIPSKSEI